MVLLEQRNWGPGSHAQANRLFGDEYCCTITAYAHQHNNTLTGLTLDFKCLLFMLSLANSNET